MTAHTNSAPHLMMAASVGAIAGWASAPMTGLYTAMGSLVISLIVEILSHWRQQ